MNATDVSTLPLRSGVFMEAMLEPSADHKKNRMMQGVVSLVVHTGAIAALVILPLFISSSLSMQQLNHTYLVAPPPAAPAPLQPVPARAESVATKPQISLVKLAVPTAISKQIVTSAPESAMAAPTIFSSGGVVGGMGAILGGDASAAPPPPPIAAAAPKKPLMISGDMKQPVLLYAPPLLYPAIARISHVSGMVVVEAVIDEQGRVVEAKPVSGPALLYNAAVGSVTQRRYQPTILDGEPTSIQLRVEVNFKMSL